MCDTPSQPEIDAVAYFVEAVRELRSSPFFVEEYRSLSITMTAGEPKENIQGVFPDRNIVRSTLVPFRRVWQQSEPCYHVKVSNILKRYVPKFRAFLNSLAFDGTVSVTNGVGYISAINPPTAGTVRHLFQAAAPGTVVILR